MATILVEDLSKTFEDHAALKSLSLEVASGEMVALIGASGSGKSTLIRAISGLIRGDADGASRVSIDGRVMQERGRLSRNAKSIRRDVGVIFQQFNLVNRLSVLMNVLCGLLGRTPVWRATLGLFTPAEKSIALAALDRVGILPTAKRRASTLSGGQQQRAAIARALVQRARLVLADEPIASLDPGSAHRVMETLADINAEQGITVVVSLHQVEYARRFCPRTIALRDGAIAYDGPSEALTDAFLTELYGDSAEELILSSSSMRRPTREPHPDVALATA